jgi:hypothetical protein
VRKRQDVVLKEMNAPRETIEAIKKGFSGMNKKDMVDVLYGVVDISDTR